MLQQYLPFTVLKQSEMISSLVEKLLKELQQYLPFTVLKQSRLMICVKEEWQSCNSTYRLRY